MASPPDSRSMSRRDSSTRSSSDKRRPRLLRASATEPSITTSNASRNSLASSHSSRRATELLNKVAFSSGSPPDSIIRPSSPLSTRSAMFDSPGRQSDFSTSPVSHQDGFDDMPHRPHTGRYFSFPSFDMYEDHQHEDDERKNPEPKSP
ncbi:hypothetical protein B0T18DRAFT_425146 [Schizothecium vesticola]|uniref:Uncharacterized protein n=1 Tax=Schizothecium vesticola TaxID=314040 RepID=A0AA40FBV3_9PEZI|nr:hypothetical protein B0T18DRAFT_425146 [Schizothecium vesticola]